MPEEISIPPQSRQHVNSTVFTQIRQQMPGDPEIIPRIIASFLRASPPMFAALRTAILADDPAAVHTAAHTMKSSNAQIGAQELAAKCHELELLGAMGQLIDTRQLLQELELEYQGVQLELEQILADLAGGKW